MMILGDGSQKGELKTKAALLGIGNLVTFVGNVKNEDVKHYVHAADLFLICIKIQRHRESFWQKRWQQELR